VTVVQAPQSSQNIRHLRVDSRLQYECVRRYLHDCRSLSKEFKFSDIAVDDDNVHIDGKRESVLELHRNELKHRHAHCGHAHNLTAIYLFTFIRMMDDI